MKIVLILLALVISTQSVAGSARAGTFSLLLQSTIYALQTSDVSAWRVGDFTEHKINMGNQTGSSRSIVAEISESGAWVEQNIELGLIGKQKVEMFFSRQTGQLLILKVNGEVQEVPESNEEVVEVKETRIYVPAGTFACVYTKAKDRKSGEISESWVNARKIPIFGYIKTKSPGPLGLIIMELIAFGRK